MDTTKYTTKDKLLLLGASALTDAELINVLVGDCPSTVMEEGLHAMGKMTTIEMTRKGATKAKATALVAAFELGKRRKEWTESERPKIGSSREGYEVICADLMDLPHEEFWVLLLNRANRLIRKHRVSMGGVSGTVADPKVIFKAALDYQASGIIAVHNHPSGNRTASQSDIDLTRKLKEAGKFLEIQLLDHLIVCGPKYFSFADEGML